MPTKKKRMSRGTTKTSTARKNLSRRAMIAALGAGLVGSGLRRAAKALPMPEATPSPTAKDFGFSGPGHFKSDQWFQINPAKPWIKVTCLKNGEIEVRCSQNGNG